MGALIAILIIVCLVYAGILIVANANPPVCGGGSVRILVPVGTAPFQSVVPGCSATATPATAP